MSDMPHVCVVSQRQLSRMLLGELLRMRCGVAVGSQFASLDEAAKRVGSIQLVVCDMDGISARALDAFTARARAKSPRLGIVRVEPMDSSDDIVRKVLAFVAPAGRSTEKLTPHELDVLLAVAAGLRNSEVARRMRRSPKTVEKHRANLQRKLGLRNLAQLTAFAIHNGLLSVEAIIGLRRDRTHGDV
jgi:DNA-binding NarL/FixJ family response regulator